jgi:hypothetical protein
MMTAKTITVADLVERQPWEIAERLGLGYSGDCNPLSHGGYFYSLADWDDHGYAECLDVALVDGMVIVEVGSIGLITNLDQALDHIGAEGSDRNSPAAQIEACKAYWGSDVHEDFSGRYSREFPESLLDEDGGEERIWREIIGWLIGLSE